MTRWCSRGAVCAPYSRRACGISLADSRTGAGSCTCTPPLASDAKADSRRKTGSSPSNQSVEAALPLILDQWLDISRISDVDGVLFDDFGGVGGKHGILKSEVGGGVASGEGAHGAIQQEVASHSVRR